MSVQMADEINKIHTAFKMKEKLENDIVALLHEYEDNTGLKVTEIKFHRLETIKVHSPYYTILDLRIS